MLKKLIGVCFFVFSAQASQPQKDKNDAQSSAASSPTVASMVANEAPAHNAAALSSNVQNGAVQGECILDLLSSMTPEQFAKLWRFLENRAEQKEEEKQTK